MAKRAKRRQKRPASNREQERRSLLDRYRQSPPLILGTVLLAILALGVYSTWRRGLSFDPGALLVRAVVYAVIFGLAIALSYFIRSRAGRRR